MQQHPEHTTPTYLGLPISTDSDNDNDNEDVLALELESIAATAAAIAHLKQALAGSTNRVQQFARLRAALEDIKAAALSLSVDARCLAMEGVRSIRFDMKFPKLKILGTVNRDCEEFLTKCKQLLWECQQFRNVNADAERLAQELSSSKSILGISGAVSGLRMDIGSVEKSVKKMQDAVQRVQHFLTSLSNLQMQQLHVDPQGAGTVSDEVQKASSSVLDGLNSAGEALETAAVLA
jgi:hypothetical protein